MNRDIESCTYQFNFRDCSLGFTAEDFKNQSGAHSNDTYKHKYTKTRRGWSLKYTLPEENTAKCIVEYCNKAIEKKILI